MGNVVKLRSTGWWHGNVTHTLSGTSAKSAVTLNGGGAAVKGLSYAAKGVSLR